MALFEIRGRRPSALAGVRCPAKATGSSLESPFGQVAVEVLRRSTVEQHELVRVPRDGRDGRRRQCVAGMALEGDVGVEGATFGLEAGVRQCG